MINNCTQCTEKFEIHDEDREFLNRFDAPDPVTCWDCRSQQRIAHRNETSIYADECDLCNKQMISQYSPDKDLTVYCKECWWSDKWDPIQYGVEYDESKPFFQQFNTLLRTVPLINLLDMKSVNSDYTNCTSNNKSCYLIFSADYNEDCMYSNWVMHSKDTVDSFRISKSEKVYESLFGENLYNCQYLVNCHTARDSMYCYDSRNIQDCTLSWNLRNKQYVIYNKQYTEEEYHKKLQELKLNTHEGRQKALTEFNAIIEEKAIHHFRVQQGRIENSTGDYIRNVSNVHDCFDIEDGVNLRHVRNMDVIKDCMECEYGGEGEDGLQNIETYPMPTHAMCTYGCYGGDNIFYSFYVMNSKNMFGSSGIKKGQYVILNKQYTKEEYEQVLASIIANMKDAGEWGEYFPIKNSLFAYNETNAQHWFELTKDEVINKGLTWQDDTQLAVGTGESLVSAELPSTIQEVDAESIISQSIQCGACSKAYRITKQELEFYQGHDIPLPRQCYECRYKRRRGWHNALELLEEQCTCEETDHTTHDGRCSVVFNSALFDTYNNVYCGDCYKASIY